jgi:septal ring factor EnvC (AmiA/AmiB activator)
MDVSRALRHVHEDIDTENQWARAVRGLQGMSNMELALVWRELADAALGREEVVVLLSQYKMIFKLAVREAGRLYTPMLACCDEGAFPSDRQIAEKTDIIVQREEEIKTMKEGMESKIQEQTNVIRELEEKTETQLGLIDVMNSKITEITSLNKNQRMKIHEYEQQIDRLKNSMHSHRDVMTRLTKTVAEQEDEIRKLVAKSRPHTAAV